LNKFALQYVIKKTQENQEGLKMKGTRQHQLLVYTDDVNILKKKKKKNINAVIAQSVERWATGWTIGV
jgi:hypothetical protein